MGTKEFPRLLVLCASGHHSVSTHWASVRTPRTGHARGPLRQIHFVSALLVTDQGSPYLITDYSGAKVHNSLQWVSLLLLRL